jgi:Family of unknown function (DUF6232)
MNTFRRTASGPDDARHARIAGTRTTMTLYYRDSSVVITDTELRVGGTTYWLDEMDAVWAEQGQRHVGRTVAVIGLRLAVAAAILVLGLVLALRVLKSHMPVLGALSAGTRDAIGWGSLVGSPVVLGALIYTAERVNDRGTRERHLCAQIGGSDVLLVSTSNVMRFGQINRALLRALEAAGRR